MLVLLLTFFLIAVLTSFLCSLWEAVLLSVTPAYAEIKMQEGARTGRTLKNFKENIDRPLAAILTLNTIAHTVGAIGVGDQAAKIWADAHPSITVFVIPALMTLAILILSEIIPKTIGANFWKELVPFTVNSLSLLIKLLFPLVWLSQLLTQVLKRDKSRSVLSRSDFLAMAEIGARQGVLAEHESQILDNLLRFHQVRARDVMTPRTVVKAAPEETSIEAYYQANPKLRFSRLPTCQQGSMDKISGYVLKDELLARLVDQQGHLPIGSIRREIMVIHEAFSIPQLFNLFIGKREHIALVIDEFGGMAGIVTMEDVIETLLGLEIVDELDNVEDMQNLARKNWERRARLLGLIEEASRQEGAGPDNGEEHAMPHEQQQKSETDNQNE